VHLQIKESCLMGDIEPYLSRIADALERLAPKPVTLPNPDQGHVFVWESAARRLAPIATPRRVPLQHLLGIDAQKARLLANTEQFARGHPANHALLWGARGTGKSALVKAVHGQVSAQFPNVKLVDMGRDDIASVPELASALAQAGWRGILFIDDLSFERGEESYKALKSVLDGGVSNDLDNLLVYVTSNRRHLINRPDGSQADMRPDETVEEQMALSERFGLWLGFHAMDQALWLSIVRVYCDAFDLNAADPALERTALQWAASRGARSGRSAWQFITERAGAMGKTTRWD
jgi:uncharacterized protein